MQLGPTKFKLCHHDFGDGTNFKYRVGHGGCGIEIQNASRRPMQLPVLPDGKRDGWDAVFLDQEPV